MMNSYNVDMIVGGNCQVVNEANCTIIKIKDETGEGVMTVYELFDGVSIIYNDFHMHSCKSNVEMQANIFCIDHCKEGQLEHTIKDGVYAYTRAGDLKIDTRKNHKGDIIMPLNNYHGITICIDMDKADTSIKKVFTFYNMNLNDLKNKFCQNDEPYVISKLESIKHIFDELYSVPNKIRKPYIILKVLEILLFLESVEVTKEKNEYVYYYKNHVEKVKAIHKLMIENMDRHYTLDELSKRFNISLTIMKKCFKSIYGDSIYSYMKTYKMNQAAIYLKTYKEVNICDIAGNVGYESPGKFSNAFKSVIGMTPLQYRKKFT